MNGRRNGYRAAGNGRRSPTPVKIVVAGGLGVGKTTFINSVSETEPRTAEAATDVGRVTLGDDPLRAVLEARGDVGE